MLGSVSHYFSHSTNWNNFHVKQLLCGVFRGLSRDTGRLNFWYWATDSIILECVVAAIVEGQECNRENHSCYNRLIEQLSHRDNNWPWKMIWKTRVLVKVA